MNKKYDFSSLEKTVEIRKENFIKDTNSTSSEGKFSIKPVSYFKDSMRRFKKNMMSKIAFVILILISLYSVLTMIFSPFSRIDNLEYNIDGKYISLLLPKLFENTNFWDGSDIRTVNDSIYYTYKYYDTKSPIREEIKVESASYEDELIYGKQSLHEIRYDSYCVGSQIVNLSKKEYTDLIEYQEKNNLNIVLKMVDYKSYLNSYKKELEKSPFNYSSQMISLTIDTMLKTYTNNSNITYKIVPLTNEQGKIINTNVFLPKFDNDEIIPIYADKTKDSDGKLIDGNINNGEYQIRVDFYKYFTYKYGFEPKFIFGSNSAGLDLFYRLAKGTLFSLMLGLFVSVVNFIIGLIYGAIEGYYGGKLDMFMERVCDIIAAIPSTIILVICNIGFNNMSFLSSSLALVLGLFVAFILTGWISVASKTRMQFYRFKNQDYVLASKSLGAKDRRIIFKHILPNAIGVLITSSILMIPSVIFSESSLSYLGIIDFSTTSLSSIGQLLNEGSLALGTKNSYLLLFPSILVSLLMVSFNLFGNGLRDAFNTNARGDL